MFGDPWSGDAITGVMVLVGWRKSVGWPGGRLVYLFPQVTTDICVKKQTGEVTRINKNYNEHFKRILLVFSPQ